MATITITAPDDWVAAVGPDLVARAGEIFEHAFCQKVLDAWGKTFEETTTAEKVELFCLHAMWKERARRRVSVASGQATDGTVDEF
jgi:hypothetical protein